MSLSTASTFDPILSEALNKIGANQFVGTRILPVRNSSVKNGDYPVFDDAQFDLNASSVRAPGSAFSRRDFDYTKQSFACKQYALEGLLPDEDEVEAAENGISDAAAAIAQKLQRDLMVGHELRVASLLQSASFETAATSAAMSDQSAATPIKDIGDGTSLGRVFCLKAAIGRRAACWNVSRARVVPWRRWDNEWPWGC